VPADRECLKVRLRALDRSDDRRLAMELRSRVNARKAAVAGSWKRPQLWEQQSPGALAPPGAPAARDPDCTSSRWTGLAQRSILWVRQLLLRRRAVWLTSSNDSAHGLETMRHAVHYSG